MSVPHAQPHHLALSGELNFGAVRVGVAYKRTLTLTNPFGCALEVTVRASSKTRYTLSPEVLTLGARASGTIEVVLRLPRAVNARGTVEDSFTLRSSLGVQRCSALFSVAGAPAAPR